MLSQGTCIAPASANRNSHACFKPLDNGCKPFVFQWFSVRGWKIQRIQQNVTPYRQGEYILCSLFEGSVFAGFRWLDRLPCETFDGCRCLRAKAPPLALSRPCTPELECMSSATKDGRKAAWGPLPMSSLNGHAPPRLSPDAACTANVACRTGVKSGDIRPRFALLLSDLARPLVVRPREDHHRQASRLRRRAIARVCCLWLATQW